METKMQTKQLILRGHIIDSLILSKLLDQISELGVDCYTSDIKIGAKRQDVSEATFTVESEDSAKLEEAVALAKKHGATEN
jgi:hypothetical protein